MIQKKHNPALFGSAYDENRSLLPIDFSENIDEYLYPLVNSGTALYSLRHRKYLQAVAIPSALNPGSWIPSGMTSATRLLNCLMVVDTEKYPHGYTEDETIILNKVKSNNFQPMPICTVSGCDNLSVPGDDKCAKHTSSSSAH